MPKFISVVIISMAVRQEGAKKRARHWETRKSGKNICVETEKKVLNYLELYFLVF